MTPLTSRQADILRLVLALGRPNVNDLVRGRQGSQGQSPSKLKHNLDELVGEHSLRMDPVGNEHRYTITKLGLRHLAKYEAGTADSSIGTLIEISQATADLQFQRAHNQIKELAEQPSFPIPFEDWERHKAKVSRGTHISAKEDEALWKHPYHIQHQKVDELIKISHALFFKMERPPKYDSAYYDGACISAQDDGITVLSKSLREHQSKCDEMLRKILVEGKKDPQKQMWLKKLGAYNCYPSFLQDSP